MDVRRADAADLPQVSVLRVARPDGADGHHVGEVDRVDDRAADVGVDVARQAPEPGVGGIEGLFADGESSGLDDLFDGLQLSPSVLQVLVPDGDRGGQEAEGDEVLAELLKGGVGVGGLVRGVGVDERGLLFGRFLLQQGHEAFALLPPLAAVFLEQIARLLFVHAEKARHPPVLDRQVVERVEHAGERGRRESRERAGGQKDVAQHRHVAGGERHVRQQGVEVHRGLGHSQRMPVQSRSCCANTRGSARRSARPPRERRPRRCRPPPRRFSGKLRGLDASPPRRRACSPDRRRRVRRRGSASPRAFARRR